MQRRFPKPKVITFSPSTLLTSVPSAFRKRSGLKENGSSHSSLKGSENKGIKNIALTGLKAYKSLGRDAFGEGNEDYYCLSLQLSMKWPGERHVTVFL